MGPRHEHGDVEFRGGRDRPGFPSGDAQRDGIGTGGDDLVLTEIDGNPLLVAIPGDVDMDGTVTILIENPVFGEEPLPGDAVILNGNIGTSEDVGWAGGDIDGTARSRS